MAILHAVIKGCRWGKDYGESTPASSVVAQKWYICKRKRVNNLWPSDPILQIYSKEIVVGKVMSDKWLIDRHLHGYIDTHRDM